MYGASLRWRAPYPNLYEARAGLDHREYGDPWTFGANVRLRGPVAFISLGAGHDTPNGNYRSKRAVLRLLKRWGIRRAWWIDDPKTGRIGWVGL